MFKIEKSRSILNRFDLARFMPYYDGIGFDIKDSQFLEELRSLPIEGRFTVSEYDQIRLDRISYEVYGDVQFWWVFILYNNLRSIFEVKSGRVMRYPSRVSLESLLSGLR